MRNVANRFIHVCWSLGVILVFGVFGACGTDDGAKESCQQRESLTQQCLGPQVAAHCNADALGTYPEEPLPTCEHMTQMLNSTASSGFTEEKPKYDKTFQYPCCYHECLWWVRINGHRVCLQWGCRPCP